MENNKGKIFKKGSKQSGITLVALVVTIVVLLILAGISINLILQNNGIVAKAEEGREKYGQAKENEQTDMDSVVEWIDKIGTVEPENIEDWEYTENEDGTLTITKYKGNDTVVVIPNSIDGKRVIATQGSCWGSLWDDSICTGSSHNSLTFWYTTDQTTIEKVVISEGIERIGEFSFTSSIAVREVVFPTTIKTIEAYAFTGCSSLSSVSIPDSITEIATYAFGSCTSLSEINIPNSVTSIESNAFSGCSNLRKVTIPDSVTSIGRYAFSWCSNLTNIIIPEYVTSIGYGAFSNCTNLAEMHIPNSVISIGDYAFEKCTSLTEITIPESVTSMGNYAFKSIKNIKVNVPYKEGEEPSGWGYAWERTDDDCVVTINYKS